MRTPDPDFIELPNGAQVPASVLRWLNRRRRLAAAARETGRPAPDASVDDIKFAVRHARSLGLICAADLRRARQVH